jgi:hypothetical protein
VIIELGSEVSGGHSRPKILPLPNGPYYLINDMEPKIVENLQNSKGEPLSSTAGVACAAVVNLKTNPSVMGLIV